MLKIKLTWCFGWINTGSEKKDDSTMSQRLMTKETKHRELGRLEEEQLVEHGTDYHVWEVCDVY